MKTVSKCLLALLLVFASAAAAFAADLAAIDRISVLMTKPQVTAILGASDRVTDMSGLQVELYLVPGEGALAALGFIYGEERTLAGHAFIFRGNVAAQTAARLQTLGFTDLEEKDGFVRLTGKDDDTGRPIVVTIRQIDDLTTVTAFEKGFYDRHASR